MSNYLPPVCVRVDNVHYKYCISIWAGHRHFVFKARVECRKITLSMETKVKMPSETNLKEKRINFSF